jgi:predicted negative regulator of RcsB-dependent stress response
MKSKRRHELQQNDLADWIADLIERVKPYSKIALASVVAVVVLAGGAMYLMSRASGRQASAWQEYLQAVNSADLKKLKDMVAANEETSAAVAASMQIGLRQLEAGNSLLLTDASEARVSLEDAITHFNKAREWTDDDLVKQVATYQLARGHESLGNIDRAMSEYKELVTGDWKDCALSKQAGERLEDLKRPSTQEFYNWHQTARATSPSSTRPPTRTGPDAKPLDLPEGPSEEATSQGPPPTSLQPADQPKPPVDAAPAGDKKPEAPATKPGNEAEPADEKNPAAETKPDEKPAPPIPEKKPSVEPPQ